MSSLDRSRASFASLFDGVDGPAVARVTAMLDLPSIAPLSAYAALSDENDYGFLLESAEKTPSSDPDGAFSPGTATDRHARYSFVGYDPEAVVTVDADGASVESLGGRAARYVEPDDGDVLDALRGALPDAERVGFDGGEETARQRLDGGLVGFLAYDAVYDLWLEEVGVERPAAHAEESATPDAQFVLTTKTLVFDHATDSVSLVFTPVVGPDDSPERVYGELESETTRLREKLAGAETPDHGGFEKHDETAESQEAYEAAVRETKRHVLDGDIYQGVISRTRELRGRIDPLGLYASLREVNPSPYMYLLRHGDRTVVGASPETLVSVRGDRVVANPIAGTCPRGDSPVEDRRLAGEMLADDKERSEHTMLVDLARNDVRRVSEAGSVRVEEFMNVLKYSHVQHIESTVSGTLDAESDVAEGTSAGRQTRSVDAFDATRASFPAGTLSGAPKVRAMEIIDALETTPRGLYGGGVGYYSWTGDADVAIVIRTATIERGDDGDDLVRVRAGAGIVADSDPTAEYEETEQKMGGVLDALERIEDECGESDGRGENDEKAPAEATR
ncbi:anthranilate synthase component I [Haloprofundus salinisoli]|uniref:anthranilate synthase component I n=1 Tax=Haloprofundus salinisoli TaxID=2876193 RepID=UPI001CCB35D5|nr:anthranilate synthase component I [Haloprofundus salinisoli]